MSNTARLLALLRSDHPALRSGAAGRLLRQCLVAGVLVACVDDSPTEPTLGVQVALSARITGLSRSIDYGVQVHVAYRRATGELVSLVSPPARFSVSPGTSSHSLNVDISPCLEDDQRQDQDAEECLLVIQVDLLDEGGEILATANQDAPNPVRRGGTVSLATVNLTPLPPATDIILDPVILDFATTASAATLPGSQTVTISTSEGGTLAGISAGGISYRPSGVEWLQPLTLDQASASGGAPATLTLQPSTTTLTPGDYSATISIAAGTGASNSPQSVTVNYRVDPATAPPTLVLTPASLNFGPVTRSGAIPAAKPVRIQSSTGAPLAPLTVTETRYDPSDVPSWLTASLAPDGSVLTLVPTTTDLDPLTYTATVTVSSAVTGVAPQSVRVTYVVQLAAPSSPSRLTISLQPTTLLVGQTTQATATVTDANGSVVATLPAGAVISWASTDPTVLPGPVPSEPFKATAAALRAGTTTVSGTLTLADRTTIASNSVPVTVNARQFTLTVSFAGSGTGTVTSLETPDPLIDCTWDGSRATGTCSAAYPEGATVSLRPTPDANSSFDGWGETCVGDESNECSFVMQQDVNAAATFTLSRAGTITGVVRNAVNAASIASATVELRAGPNDTTSPPVATTVSARDGSYRFDGLPAGSYTLQAEATGYIKGQASDVVVSGDETTSRDIVLSPLLLEGETRIILTWGETPADLDAHLTGPNTDGSRFHVFFLAKGSLGGEPFALLDIDDRNGNGPETVTIGQQRPGVYRFSVHNYSNRADSESAVLAGSGARVQVLQGDRLVAQFDVPQERGTLWTVFELDGVRLTAVNDMSNGPLTSSWATARAPDDSIIRSASATGK